MDKVLRDRYKVQGLTSSPTRLASNADDRSTTQLHQLE